jgi:hypothetical protein
MSSLHPALPYTTTSLDGSVLPLSNIQAGRPIGRCWPKAERQLWAKQRREPDLNSIATVGGFGDVDRIPVFGELITQPDLLCRRLCR